MANDLGNQALLGKIDALRSLNIGSMIPLPQLVVVGDQSSGKSSVLESLTGFSFPRAAELCTRYATQITCCRDESDSVQISIIPRPDANDATKEKLRRFKRQVNSMDNDKLAAVFGEANLAMDLRMSGDDTDWNLNAFSEDILKIEIYGPTQNHLTVIDVPGIFRVATPGLTTENDIVLVENMVKQYMKDNRTIILAVVPCNVDIATQEILKLAEAADPHGQRTMGILTKPDLATETATKNAAINLLSGKRSILKLGYFVVKNRGADDATSSLEKREADEKAFFSAPPWSSVRDRCGVAAVKLRLGKLLMTISKREFPHVKSEIEQRLCRCRKDIESMGPARVDESAQREYLGKLAIRFQNIARAALKADYASEKIFETNPQLRLVTRMINLHEGFSRTLNTKGHEQNFVSKPDPAKTEEPFKYIEDDARSESCISGYQSPTPSLSTRQLPELHDFFQAEIYECPILKNDDISSLSTRLFPELHDLIQAEIYECPIPKSDDILEYVKGVYNANRGPELGTFGGSILASIFKHQSKKWAPLTLSHISDAIVWVHYFIRNVLDELCHEEQVHSQLWDCFLTTSLRASYSRAMAHTRFLLDIERGGHPITFNRHFNRILQRIRGERIAKLAEKTTILYAPYHGKSRERCVTIASLREQAVKKANTEQISEDILDTFASYYKVASKRFIDVIYQQVISYFLLEGDGCPLKVFGPEMVMKLKGEELELIAGEDEESKQRRIILQRELQSLEEALKILRS